MRLLSLLVALILVFASGSAALADGTVSAPNVAGGQASGLASTLVICDKTVHVNGTGSSAVEIAHVTGKTTYICAMSLNLAQNVSTVAYYSWGTGSACGTSPQQASPVIYIGTAVTGPNSYFTFGSGIGYIDHSPVAGTSDFCLIVGGTSVTAAGTITYTQF